MDIGKDAHRVKSLSRHTLEQLVMHSSEGILLADAKDSKLRVVYANPAYEDLSGYSLAELTGKCWSLAQRDGEPGLDKLRASIGRAEACRVVVADLRKDGTSWLSDVSIEPLHNARGELKYFLCIQKPASAAAERVSSPSVADVRVVADNGVDPEDAPASVAIVSAPSRPEPPGATVVDPVAAGARAKVTNVNRIDQATGLLRVDHFLDLVRRDAEVARRDRCSLSFAVIEIVEFDSYRQTFGVKAGDSCQRMIGVQLTRVLRRAGDLCARYDGSTLVAAVLGQEPEQLRRLMNQVVENVRQLGLHNPRAKSGRYIWIRYTVAGMTAGGGRTYKFFNGSTVFPFGYGLSYTKFNYTLTALQTSQPIKLNRFQHCRDLLYKNETFKPSCPAVLVDDLKCQNKIGFEIELKNVGNRDGNEVVLVYSQPPDGIVGTHFKQLIGFQRVFVAAGTGKKIQFTFSVCQSLAIVDYNGYSLLPSGGHTIIVSDGAISFQIQDFIRDARNENSYCIILGNTYSLYSLGPSLIMLRVQAKNTTCITSLLTVVINLELSLL